MKSLSVILGCACCAFLLACSDDGSTTSVLDNPYDERSSSSEEALESSSSEQVLSSSEVQSSSSEKVDLTSSSVASSESKPQFSSSSSAPAERPESSSSSVDAGDSTLTYERECGSLVDQRDGKSYCTVKIGTQTWMGENLDYEVAGSKCYKDVPENCEKFGRLYTYAQTMGRAENECGPGWMCKGNYPLSPGICPDGWTVPTKKDWETLENYIEKHNGSEPAYVSMLAKPEDSKRDDITLGSDLSGFRILVLGTYNPEISSYSDSSVYFWSATEDDVNLAYSFGFDLYNLDVFDLVWQAWKRSYRSVRCIRNKE